MAMASIHRWRHRRLELIPHVLHKVKRRSDVLGVGMEIPQQQAPVVFFRIRGRWGHNVTHPLKHMSLGSSIDRHPQKGVENVEKHVKPSTTIRSTDDVTLPDFKFF